MFSPVCDCERDEAAIAFRLREGDRVDLADRGRRRRRRPHARSSPAASPAGASRRAGTGATTPATSSPRARTGRASIWHGSAARSCSRTRSRSTSRRPSPSWSRSTRRVFSPDGDGRSDKVTVRYRMSEPANALLLVDGEQRVRTRFAPVEGKLDWFGIVDGKPLRRGVHALQVVGVDRAGNRSQPTGETRVRIRSIDLARALVRVPPRVRFGIGVDTDAASYRWRFAGGTGDGQRAAPRPPRARPAGPVHALRRGQRARRPRHGARPCTLSWRRSAGSWAPPGSRSSSSRRRAASGWSASSPGPPAARPSRSRWRRAGAAS